MKQATMEKQVKVLYIGGYGRSGSTLLVRLLGQIPDFVAVGEIWNIWQKCFTENELCGCGVPFQECPFWSQVVAEAFGGFDKVDLEGIKSLRRSLQNHAYLLRLAYPGLRSDRHQQEIAEYCKVLGKLYRAIQSVSGSRVIIDSSKGPRYAMLLKETREIDLHVVHLIRDSRAVVYSWQKKKIKPEVYWKTEYMDRPDPVWAALNWDITNTFTRAFRGSRAKYHFVRYEDLVESPQDAMARIIEFTGERVEDAHIFEQNGRTHDTVRLKVDHTAVGNPNRFRQGPVEVRRDEEWRDRMPGVQKHLVTALTFPLLYKYGYMQGNTNGSRSAG